MSNPSKRKGSQFESDVVAYLAEHGFPLAERRVTRGAKDAGDIAGVPGWCLELKATKQLNLASAIDEARLEAKNARAEHFAAIVKRPRKPISEAYVVVPLAEFLEVMR